MLAERQIKTLTSPTLVLDLPESFANRKVEIVVLALDEDSPPWQRREPPLSLPVALENWAM